MLYCNKIDVLEGIDINKSNKLKECIICHYLYFLYLKYTYYISVMTCELENVAILNIKGNG